ncbi:hypothetical protein (DUF1644) [Arabidopsis thaliana]|uniref:Uncharacterized protein At2g26050 n=1 Tax=Arabidopsis thaliana TaxID=3702 RepID=O80991_ARATH|nr:hypothetical protein (DUF1644) [Arabidopsis thaliana]AAC31231.1 hypothetical protein [Arabidopsis thaliana]AEC07789.1 hypothetical protein (DUF1644) [Arabidopsis thaliana]|eukprot:NP_180175.1 hypothetical protein (DUF1644) [Arabidopsis thaliana]
MCESSNKVRVSPYPLRSSRTDKHKASESPIETGWEDVRGCHPYMCDTSVRHSNCFKQFRRKTIKKRLYPKTLHCPLCRGEVSETTKVTSTARRFMNAKPRSCSVEDCKFSGTFSQLTKHLKTEHRGIVPPKVDPLRQQRWEMMERHSEYVELMTAAGISRMAEVMQQQLPQDQNHPHVFQVTVNGTIWNLIDPSQGRNGLGITNYSAMQFVPLSINHSRTL